MGCSLSARGLYGKAIYCWTRTLDLDPQHPLVHLRIAEALWNKGDLEQARQHYLCGLRQDPGSTSILLDLSELYLRSRYRYVAARPRGPLLPRAVARAARSR
jgi:tetratricopeptide (TPR) repeat protein